MYTSQSVVYVKAMEEKARIPDLATIPQLQAEIHEKLQKKRGPALTGLDDTEMTGLDDETVDLLQSLDRLLKLLKWSNRRYDQLEIIDSVLEKVLVSGPCTEKLYLRKGKIRDIFNHSFNLTPRYREAFGGFGSARRRYQDLA